MTSLRAVIVLDMIGDKDLSITLPRNSDPALLTMVFDAAREEDARYQFELFPGAIGDDHVPFLEAGIPAIDIIDFFYGSRPRRNDYWHTGEDNMEKISAASLQTVGRVALRVINRLMDEADQE